MTSALQQAIDTTKHSTVDVLGKSAIAVPVDITATVVLKKNFVQNVVDDAIRTNLGILFSKLRMKTPLRQSDVVASIDDTTGVSYVVLPMTKMARSFGSQVAMDSLNSSQLGDSVRIDYWSNATVSVWLLTQTLTAATTTGGGPDGQFKGVYQDDYLLTLQSTLPERLQNAAGVSFIIGAEGLVIPGYSDDATLTSQGYVTAAERLARRVEITANRVMVSLAIGDAPQNHDYFATYIVGFVTGVQDINPTSAEYLTPGVIEFTFTVDPKG